MTYINNLFSILREGLFSHNEAYRRKLIKADISDPDVQDRRATRRIDGVFLHDYVSLYFSPRNPMLYRRKEIQEDIIILGLDPLLLFEENVIFSDGNAAASLTRFYRGVQMLENLSWDTIHANYWNDIEDGRRLKCAEVLVHPVISRDRIQVIFCCSQKHSSAIIAATKEFGLPAFVDPELYF